jgi:glycine dehydrogenase subunit 2
MSWEKLTQDTGVTTDDIDRRIIDYGFQTFFASHHPRLIPEPFTPEPTETYSKADIDAFVGAFRNIALESYADPELVKTAPHRTALQSRIDSRDLTEFGRFACTWRQYQKMRKQKGGVTNDNG